jgi:hypothetical protein
MAHAIYTNLKNILENKIQLKKTIDSKKLDKKLREIILLSFPAV